MIAYVYDNTEDEFEGKPKIFAYAPVSFEQSFQEDPITGNHHFIKITIAIILCTLISLLLMFALRHFLKKKAQWQPGSQGHHVGSRASHSMEDPGFQLRNMPYDACTNPKYGSGSTASQSSSMASSAGIGTISDRSESSVDTEGIE